MQINKTKVQIVSKKSFETDCSCLICRKEVQNNITQELAVDEVRRVLDEYVQTSGLDINGLNIQLYFPGQETRSSEKNKNKYTSHIIAMCEKIEQKSAQFLKKYRHTLLCQLRNESKRLKTDANICGILIEQANYDDAMWRYSNILRQLQEMKQLLTKINLEQIFQDTTIDRLLQLHKRSAIKAQKDAKKMVNKTLELQSTSMASW